MIELLTTSGKWICLITGILMLIHSLDTFLFKDFFYNNSFFGGITRFCNDLIPWLFGGYALVYLSYGVWVLTGIDITITITDGG